MRSFRFGYGGVVLVVVLVLAGGAFWVHARMQRLDAQSKAFVDSAMQAIAPQLDEDQVAKRATSNVDVHLEPDEQQTLVDLRKGLGPFGTYLGAKGGVTWLASLGIVGPTSAAYVAKANYQNGIATFNLTVEDHDGRWLIDSYHLDVSLLGTPGSSVLQSGTYSGIN
jgi:hypothetical protein